MIDASRLSAFSLASTASLTAQPAVAASAGDASASASASPGEGPIGFAQWLAAWTPEAAPAVPTDTVPATATGPRTDPWVRPDLPNVLSSLPPAEEAGRRASTPRMSDTPVMSWEGLAAPAAPAAGVLARPAVTTGPVDTVSVMGGDDAAGVLASEPGGGEAGSAVRDDAGPAATGTGPDATAVAAWLWSPPPLQPLPAAVAGTGSGAARHDAVTAAMPTASVLSGAVSCDEEVSRTESSSPDAKATFGDAAGVTLAPTEAAGLAMPGPAPAVHPAPSAIEVAVAAPVTAQRFGDEVSMHLAQHVSRMTGETQEVVLHLHPAEMGPVSVGIELRGGVATVEFGAAQALTRQQLEQSLPALAQALRDEGLTLGQGLVHDRPASGGSGQRRRGENQFSIGAVARASSRVEGGSDDVSISLPPALTGRRSRIDLTA